MTQKPAELLQAQIGIYSNSLPDLEGTYRKSELIIRSLGEAAAGLAAPDSATYLAKNTKKGFDDDDNHVTLQHIGDEIPLFDKKEYNASITNTGNRALAPNLAKLITGYTEYKDEITNSGMLGLTLDAAKQHPNFLSYGGSEIAFKFTHTEPNGSTKTMIARYGQMKDSEHSDTALSINLNKANGRAITFAAGAGIEGLEQGAAVSYDPPVVISEFAEGKNLYNLSADERAAIPAEHWDKLTAAVNKASAVGILLDVNSDNFIYNTDNGFTVLDYRISKSSKSKEELAESNRKDIEELKMRLLSSEVFTQN